MAWNRAAVLAACAGLACAQSMEWPAISANEAGLDAGKLEAWRSGLAAHGTTGLIVIRRGRIALEWYAPEWDANRPHGTASMAKALVGGMSLAVAMSDGRISPDDLASKYIPAWRAGSAEVEDHDPRSWRRTRPAFRMRSRTRLRTIGFPAGRAISGSATPDPFSIAVRQAPVLFEPGTRNAYSNPGMAALSYAITASLKGGDIRTLLKERVLDPLGVPEQHWSIGYGRAYEVDGLKLYANWGGATFTARAAARIGQLMMLQGPVERTGVDPARGGEKGTDGPGTAASGAQRERSRAGIGTGVVHEFGWHLAGGAARYVRGRGRAAPGDRRGAQPGSDRGAQRRRRWAIRRRVSGDRCTNWS